jgi:uncharacterized protein (TIGR02246 family)
VTSDERAVSEVRDALAKYESALASQNSQETASMFLIDGKLEHVGQQPIVGRERIQSFLMSFSDYKLLSHKMILSASSATGSRVRQLGTYKQRVRSPEGHEIDASGWFMFDWQRQAEGKWLIEHARTSSKSFESSSL